MRKFLQYFIRVIVDFIIAKIRFSNFIILFLLQICYAQNSQVDSLETNFDTININPVVVSFSDSTKIFIVKGTVTKNLINEKALENNIVFVEPKSIIHESKEIPKADKIHLVSHKEKVEKRIIIINKKDSTEVKKFSSLPYHNKSIYTSFQKNIVISNNTNYHYKLSILKSNEIDDKVLTNLIYKKSYYSYIWNSYSICISTLEIRSPSFSI